MSFLLGMQENVCGPVRERAQKKGPSRSLLKVVCRIKSNSKKTKTSGGSLTLAFRATKPDHDFLLGWFTRKRTLIVAGLRLGNKTLEVGFSFFQALGATDVEGGVLRRINGLVGNGTFLIYGIACLLGGKGKETKKEQGGEEDGLFHNIIIKLVNELNESIAGAGIPQDYNSDSPYNFIKWGEGLCHLPHPPVHQQSFHCRKSIGSSCR